MVSQSITVSDSMGFLQVDERQEPLKKIKINRSIYEFGNRFIHTQFFFYYTALHSPMSIEIFYRQTPDLGKVCLPIFPE